MAYADVHRLEISGFLDSGDLEESRSHFLKPPRLLLGGQSECEDDIPGANYVLGCLFAI
jgi:hypothetical protein